MPPRCKTCGRFYRPDVGIATLQCEECQDRWITAVSMMTYGVFLAYLFKHPDKLDQFVQQLDDAGALDEPWEVIKNVKLEDR